MTCPFCHDALDIEREPWIACAACLARHHAACWSEARACATCRGAEGLASERVVREGRLRLRSPALATAGLVLSGLLVGACAARPQAPAPVEVHVRVDDLARELAETRRTLALAGEHARLSARLTAALAAEAEHADEAGSEDAARAQRLTFLVTALEEDLATLRRQYAETRRELRERDLLLAMVENDGWGGGLVPLDPPPVIDARVLAVKEDAEPQLVLLSAGTEAGVERGFHFSVYRGSRFVGKVVAERVMRGATGARVLFLADGQAIAAGDAAATRLQ